MKRAHLLGALAKGPTYNVLKPNNGTKQFNTGAGAKHYGGGRSAPNVGKTGAAGMVGYAKRRAIMRRS